jgi:hypothetical protein
MIKLKDILLEDTKKIQMNISKDGGFKDYNDTNMDEEEWEEFQSYLSGWLQDIEDEKERKRITKLTNKVLDVDSMITEFLMMDEDTRNILKDMSDEEINKIRNILKKKRETGNTCYFYKRYGIKYLGDTGRFDKMLDWEKEYYNKHHRK